MNRVGGNRTVFLKLLRGFKKESRSLMSDMEKALGGNDRDALHRAAHTLKGISGNLGAEKIRLAAERMEHYDSDTPETSDELRSLGALLKDFDIIAERVSSEMDDSEPLRSREGTANPIPLLEKMKDCLHTDIVKAGKLLKDLENSPLSPGVLEELKEKMEGYDMDGAEDMIDRLMA